MKKKSIQLSAQQFSENVDEIANFLNRGIGARPLTQQDDSWLHDLAIIRLYREFEDMMLNTLVALINRDSETFSKHKERSFPKHMSVDVCEYLICGDGYFDFSGRSGLISTIKKIVPNDHWFPKIVKDTRYKAALERLSGLRNFAAHDSVVSKKRALKATDKKRMSSSGAWLKKHDRFSTICTSLKHMAGRIEAGAPY